MRYFESKIVSNQQITDDIFVLRVKRDGAEANAGQFYMLKSWDTELTLMRPISVFKAEPEEKAVARLEHHHDHVELAVKDFYRVKQKEIQEEEQNQNRGNSHSHQQSPARAKQPFPPFLTEYSASSAFFMAAL